MSRHRLTCHCGAVELALDLPEGLSGLSRCDCSFCLRRGASTVTVPRDGLKVVRGEDALRLYQWNTRTAEHYFCGICGIYTHHRRRSNPDEWGANLGAIDGVGRAEIEAVPWVDGVNHPSDAS